MRKKEQKSVNAKAAKALETDKQVFLHFTNEKLFLSNFKNK